VKDKKVVFEVFILLVRVNNGYLIMYAHFLCSHLKCSHFFSCSTL